MAVEYEWNLDEDISPEPEPGSRRRRARWRTPLLVALVVVLAGVLVYFLVWRSRRTSVPDAASALLAVVHLEQRAIREGDATLYLNLQDEEDATWLLAQERRLSEGVMLPPPAPGFVATGVLTVETPTVVSDRAVVPFIRRAGQPDGTQYAFRSVSFYRLLPDGRWVHTSPDPSYAGRPLAWVGPRIDLVGHMIDTDLFEHLAPELELAADAFCDLFSCVPELRFGLALTGTLGFAEADLEALPAPHLVGVPVGDEAMEAWKHAMRSHFVNLMINQVGAGYSGGFITVALRATVRAYLGVEPLREVDPARLAEALSAGQLPTLEALWAGAVPGIDRALAEDAAAVLVRYVEKEYGREGVVALLSGSSHAPDAIALLAIAFGPDAGLIEQRWLDYIAREVVRQAARYVGPTQAVFPRPS